MTPKQKYYENAAATVIKNMGKRQMQGFYCPDRAAAVQKALELIPAGSAVGWGGSVTLAETGLMDALKAGSYTLLDRAAAKTPEAVRANYEKMFNADYFLMSANAITLDGELINLDCNGNRVASLCFGPKNVLILAGMNKLVSDVESGVRRVRDLAAPPNTVRLNRNTPCAVTGRCGDCYSPDCICGQLVITRRSSDPDRIKVLLIGEELGY